MKPVRRRLASIESAIAHLAEPAPSPTYDVVRTHPATCRTNLLAWDLTGPEASRVLDELQQAQAVRQGAVIVGERPELGWVYLARAREGT